MNVAYVYLQIYRLFDEITPLKVDCGQLCNGACCKGDDCGMYLFPHEEKVYEFLKPDWVKIEKSDFTYIYNGKTYNVPLALCSGTCDRYQRPLACRIFPLTPYLDDNGNVDIMVDPRAKSVCPLSKALRVDEYDRAFVKNILKAFRLLCKNKEVYAFMQSYTAYLKDCGKFFK